LHQGRANRSHQRLIDITSITSPTVTQLAGENFLYVFKGAPSARQADRRRPKLAKNARDAHGERERAGSAAP
jgi:hypothetical protein